MLLTDQTKVGKATEGTKDEIKNGDKVLVTGQDNADGSVIAQNIQLNMVIGLPSPSASTQPK